jgi:hypothetical protein
MLLPHLHFPAPKEGEPLDVGAIRAHIEAYFAKTLRPHICSAPPDAPQLFARNSAVVSVVGSTFEKQVLDPASGDVFIRLVSPPCRQCARMTPLFTHLAADLAGWRRTAKLPPALAVTAARMTTLADRLTIAELDVSRNDVPVALNVSSLPAYFFYPANNKSHPIRFREWYSFERMKAFLNYSLTVEYGAAPALPFPLRINAGVISDELDLELFDMDLDRKMRYPPLNAMMDYGLQPIGTLPRPRPTQQQHTPLIAHRLDYAPSYALTPEQPAEAATPKAQQETVAPRSPQTEGTKVSGTPERTASSDHPEL